MALFTSDNIVQVLRAFNPWWSTGSVREEFAKTFKRTSFYNAMKIITHKSIRRTLVLTGIRRVGKTTIQYQIINELLQSGVKPARIIFISLDHPLLKLCRLNEILDAYHTNIYGDEDCYYFLDEVQYAEDWDNWVKVIYDIRPLSRMVATGSASPALKKKAAESGAGRWTVMQVPALSFYEYCEMLNYERLDIPADLKPTDLVRFQKSDFAMLMDKLAVLQKHFNRYLMVGGFPELALADDDFMAQAVMREDVIDKILKRDIPSLYKIRNAAELERIFLYICYHSSNIISVDAIAKELEGVSRLTVDDYIGYMESANLIYRSYPVAMGGKKVLKARAKIYIADAAIRNAILMGDTLSPSPEEMGIIIETSVYKYIAAFYFQQTARVGYFRDAKKDKEIDIVVDFPMERMLFEVKYRENAPIGEKDAIYNLADEATNAFVITKKQDDYGLQPSAGERPILRIPGFAFLYLLGNAERHR